MHTISTNEEHSALSLEDSQRRDEAPIGFVFWSTASLWRRTIERVLKKLDLTHIQFLSLAVIDYLHIFKHPPTQVKISEAAGFDINMTSQVLRTLEKKGFLHRKKDPSDKRITLSFITPLGEEKLRRALEMAENTDQKFFGTLGNTERNFYDSLNLLLQKNSKLSNDSADEKSFDSQNTVEPSD